MPHCRHQRSTQNRHRRHQAEVDQSHVLVKFHKAKMPGISNRRWRLVESGYGIHVDDEDAKEERRSPAHDVPRGALGAGILPQEQDPGDERERERSRIIPERQQIIHLRILPRARLTAGLPLGMTRRCAQDRLSAASTLRFDAYSPSLRDPVGCPVHCVEPMASPHAQHLFRTVRFGRHRSPVLHRSATNQVAVWHRLTGRACLSGWTSTCWCKAPLRLP